MIYVFSAVKYRELRLADEATKLLSVDNRSL
jgi:hypothetical protein